MAFSMAGGGPSGPQINITPLIDVLLTLIIVFMVVVSMDKEQRETVQIPQPDQKQTQNIRSREPWSFNCCGRKMASHHR
jgi:biopolymer transport protein TolR